MLSATEMSAEQAIFAAAGAWHVDAAFKQLWYSDAKAAVAAVQAKTASGADCGVFRCPTVAAEVPFRKTS